MRTILHALSYGNIEVESSRRLVDLKKLDAMRIFLKKLDVKVYNGDYEVPVRLYFPTEEAMQRKLQEPLDLPVLLFFHGGGWVTESVDTYNRVLRADGTVDGTDRHVGGIPSGAGVPFSDGV